jgi:hypothetical protein
MSDIEHPIEDRIKSMFEDDSDMISKIEYIAEDNKKYFDKFSLTLELFNKDTVKRMITTEYERLTKEANSESLSTDSKTSLRAELTTLLKREFPKNVKIEDKTMTLSKNCGWGGKLFCCNPLSKFTDKFVKTVNTFFSDKNVNYTLSSLFDEIRIKSNFLNLGSAIRNVACLSQQQKEFLKAIIGDNINIIQVAGSHSRRKRRASKKSRKSHRRHRRSTRNKKCNTKRHIKRHTKRYRHRK